MAVKFEKITLWISLDTDGVDDWSALDVVVPAVRGLKDDLTLLDYDTEDYKLVKVAAAKAEATIASSPELLEALETIVRTLSGCGIGLCNDNCNDNCYERAVLNGDEGKIAGGYAQVVAEQAIDKAKGGADE